MVQLTDQVWGGKHMTIMDINNKDLWANILSSII